MKVIKILIIALLVYVSMFFISNSVNAVNIERDFINDAGSINVKFSGLTLDPNNKRYEWGFTQLKNDEVKKWYDLTQFDNNKVNIIIDVLIPEMRNIVLKSDIGFVTIREKGGNNITEPIEVDLKIPLLRLTNRSVLNNGEKLNVDDKEVKVKLFDASANIEFQYEKVTDEIVINKYKEIKNNNSSIYDIEKIIKKELPVDNWKKWEIGGGWMFDIDPPAGGYPERKINVNGEGLYYMWIKAYKKNSKVGYGLILVDNLGANVPLEGISLSSSYDIKVGEEKRLNIEYTPTQASNREVTWKSEDESIATVDKEGRVKGIKTGSVKIVATSKEGNKTATTIVNVIDKDNVYVQNENKNNANTNTNANINKDTDKKINDVKKDNTTAKGRLPQTGESLIAVSAIFIIGLVMVVGIKIYNKNFKGI
ncbi:MAG: Ig-like domain-containing protein [Clostridiales bacterium]|nr:Ig-like domain-containing protein [Clostridiales bacterium]